MSKDIFFLTELLDHRVLIGKIPDFRPWVVKTVMGSKTLYVTDTLRIQSRQNLLLSKSLLLKNYPIKYDLLQYYARLLSLL